MKRIILRLAANVLSDKDSHRKIFIAIGSVAVGFLMLMFLPVALLSGIANIGSETEEVSYETEIAEAMSAIGLQERTTMAQLIYTLYFGDTPLDNFTGYANMFSEDDSENIINNINGYYGLDINYNEFFPLYITVANADISKYIFTDTSCKNSDDLAAWSRNAYDSEWEYADNFYGESVGSNGFRSADNIGLIMGYLRYSPYEKIFNTEIDTLVYTKIDSIDTMPDVQGLGVYNGNDFGVYVGDGEVIFSSAMNGIDREAIENGDWTSWCTFEGINYPQAVIDTIYDIQNTTEPPTEEDTTGDGE